MSKRPHYRFVIGLVLLIIVVFLFHEYFFSSKLIYGGDIDIGGSSSSVYFRVNRSVVIINKKNVTRTAENKSAETTDERQKELSENKTLGKCNGIDSNRPWQFRVHLDGVTYPNIVPLYHNTSIDFKCLESSGKTKTILMWTKFKGSPIVDYGHGVADPFRRMNCPVTNCELTDDRTKLKNADLVLFHLRNKIDFIPGRIKFNKIHSNNN